MDARITKQRLSNLISYDWIKIVVTIVVACLVLALLFAFTAARPRRAQEFYVYAYTDVSTGSDFSSLKEELEDGVFSYDILSVGTEGFDGSMGSTTYTLRRSVGSGNVLFVTDNRVYETDEEGQIVLDEEGEPVVETESTLYTMASAIRWRRAASSPKTVPRRASCTIRSTIWTPANAIWRSSSATIGARATSSTAIALRRRLAHERRPRRRSHARGEFCAQQEGQPFPLGRGVRAGRRAGKGAAL